jgi:hypothetical protein
MRLEKLPDREAALPEEANYFLEAFLAAAAAEPLDRRVPQVLPAMGLGTRLARRCNPVRYVQQRPRQGISEGGSVPSSHALTILRGVVAAVPLKAISCRVGRFGPPRSPAVEDAQAQQALPRLAAQRLISVRATQINPHRKRDLPPCALLGGAVTAQPRDTPLGPGHAVQQLLVRAGPEVKQTRRRSVTSRPLVRHHSIMDHDSIENGLASSSVVQRQLEHLNLRAAWRSSGSG